MNVKKSLIILPAIALFGGTLLAKPAMANPQGLNIGSIEEIFNMAIDLMPQAMQADVMAFLESQAGQQIWSIAMGSMGTGSRGLPDPQRLAQIILGQISSQNPNTRNPHIPENVSTQGIAAILAGRSNVQSQLSDGAQEQRVGRLRQLLADINRGGTFRQQSEAMVQPNRELASQNLTGANASLGWADSSEALSQTVIQQGNSAVAAISTQDVLKFIAQQNNGLAGILNNQSRQLGLGAEIGSRTSDQIANQTTQNLESANLANQNLQLGAKQIEALENLQEQSALNLLTTIEIFEHQQGQAAAALLREQGEKAQLNQNNAMGFRLLK